jgi:hypothetical protein
MTSMIGILEWLISNGDQVTLVGTSGMDLVDVAGLARSCGGVIRAAVFGTIGRGGSEVAFSFSLSVRSTVRKPLDRTSSCGGDNRGGSVNGVGRGNSATRLRMPLDRASSLEAFGGGPLGDNALEEGVWTEPPSLLEEILRKLS